MEAPVQLAVRRTRKKDRPRESFGPNPSPLPTSLNIWPRRALGRPINYTATHYKSKAHIYDAQKLAPILLLPPLPLYKPPLPLLHTPPPQSNKTIHSPHPFTNYLYLTHRLTKAQAHKDFRTRVQQCTNLPHTITNYPLQNITTTSNVRNLAFIGTTNARMTRESAFFFHPLLHSLSKQLPWLLSPTKVSQINQNMQIMDQLDQLTNDVLLTFERK